MEPVGRLVRVDADQRRLRPVDRAVELLERDVGEHVREPVAELRVEPAPERQGAPDHVLPEAALRLVEGGRAAGRERRPVERGVAAVLVEPVPDLVHRREERVAVQVVLGVARREPDVPARERHAERVHGRVEPEVLLRRPVGAGDHDRELVLDVAGVRAGQERLGRVVRRGPDELLQRGPEPVEHGAHLVGAHARLEVVEQRVVPVARVGEAVDVPVLELERPVEQRAEAREVVLRAGLRPGVHPLGAELRHLRRELGRHPARLVPVAARDGDEAGVVRVGVEIGDLGLERGEQLPDLVADEELVAEPLERREGVGPGRGAALRASSRAGPTRAPVRRP